MNTESITRAFRRIGARFGVDRFPTTRRVRARTVAPRSGYTFDVTTDRHGERFLLLWDGAADLDVQPLHVDERCRHLLLFVRHGEQRHRFLCGHDERHWFAAAVPGTGVTTVERALEALKPLGVRELQNRLDVRRNDRHRRSNRGFVRRRVVRDHTRRSV